MTTAKLTWITPNAEELLVYTARVSSPANQIAGMNSARLLKYLRRNKHWSPFEMVSACIEIETERDMSHQMLRHRSFSFQEFSQRYASTAALPKAPLREARLQDTKNRQNSVVVDDEQLQTWWRNEQKAVLRRCEKAYLGALKRGMAKECARCVLPEGLTTTRLYMTGTIRSWLHYLEQRAKPKAGQQKEHREIAQSIHTILYKAMPNTFARPRHSN